MLLESCSKRFIVLTCSRFTTSAKRQLLCNMDDYPRAFDPINHVTRRRLQTRGVPNTVLLWDQEKHFIKLRLGMKTDPKRSEHSMMPDEDRCDAVERSSGKWYTVVKRRGRHVYPATAAYLSVCEPLLWHHVSILV